jgi:hypothetical protein
MIITIKNEKPMSWNELYSGKHWSNRADEAKRVHELVRYSPCVISEDQFVAGTQDHLYSHPVAITITAYFKGRQLDPDNIASKFYIDGLKGWLITDDTPKYVDSVTTRSRVDKLNPRIEIELKEIE